MSNDAKKSVPSKKGLRQTVVAGVVIFAVIAAAGLTVYGLRKRSDRKAAEAAAANVYEPTETVETVQSRTVPFLAMTELTGTVLSRRTVRVQNEVAGVVKSVGFDSGDLVEAGQVLVTINDETDRADLAAAEASVRVKRAEGKSIQTRIALARTEHARLSEALQSQAASAMELDRVKAQWEAAEADYMSSQAEAEESIARVEQIKARLAKFTIKAPFKGRVGLRNVHEGQFLPADMGFGGASTAIAVIEETADTTFLDFAVPQEYMSRVAVGLSVMGENALLGKGPQPLKVVAIDASANTQTRNVRVRTEVDNRAGLLRPGMSVRVRVPIDEPRDYVAVPVTAVRRASFGDGVFVIAKDDKGVDRAAQRFVKLGPVVGTVEGAGQSGGGWIAVLDGVKSGETVASTGSFKLMDKMKVNVAGPQGAPGGPPPGGGPSAAAGEPSASR